ncbi:MAG: NAD-binding protein [Deltaproteobacteria bacterium]|nr:NAD-binding protein [Candidatus Anaeroferrophillacea bacterium]
MAGSTTPHRSTGFGDHFLVCGLGSLGQHCVYFIRQFGVTVSAIDLTPPRYWDVEHLDQTLDCLVVGDCRRPEVLDKCRLERYCTILLVTPDDRVNIEAAFVARRKNQRIRLVVRSTQKTLNRLLDRRLDNFVAIDPTEITAMTFTLAAFGSTNRGLFRLHDRLVRVTDHHVRAEDPLAHKSLEEIGRRNRRVLLHTRRDESPAAEEFYRWRPDTRVRQGDRLLLLETVRDGDGALLDAVAEPAVIRTRQNHAADRKTRLTKAVRFHSLRSLAAAACRRLAMPGQHNRIGRVAYSCFVTVALLVSTGMILFYGFGPNLNLTDAAYAAVNLLLGGYFDLFGNELRFTLPLPGWLRLFGLLTTVAGTVLVGTIYALITSHILEASFHFSRRQRPPASDHVVLVGDGPLGRQIAALLAEFHQPYVVMARKTDETTAATVLTYTSDVGGTLQNANIHAARAVISVTDDELLNLELCLLARQANPACRLVLRAYDRHFSGPIADLFPDAAVLCSSALGAEAFAAAAFGESITNLFIQNDRTTLVTRYTVTEGDTLIGRILADIAYGYRVVPLLLVEGRERQTTWLPGDDKRLNRGDELTVLATIDSLRRIEKGEHVPPATYLVVEKGPADWAVAEGARQMAKISGGGIGTAREFLQNLPGEWPAPLYLQQAIRLERALKNMGFAVHLKENEA